jgi:hypothetical protein
VSPPTPAELQTLVQSSISERVGRHLERRGVLASDAENSYVAREADGKDALRDQQGIFPVSSG